MISLCPFVASGKTFHLWNLKVIFDLAVAESLFEEKDSQDGKHNPYDKDDYKHIEETW